MQDCELYELVGLGWRFPVWVKWLSQSQAELTIVDIPLLKRQRATIEAALRQFSTHRDSNTWFFAPAGLLKCAFKSQQTDPEDVVVWRPGESEQAPISDFITAYTEWRDAVPHPLMLNPASLLIIWNSLCKFMLEWMVFHDRQVDLGFARLDAFCARANWKNAVTGRLVARRRNKGSGTDTETVRRETRRLLHQSFVTAVDLQTNTARWSLEVTPRKSFHDAAQVREIKRKRQPRGSYSFHVLQFLKSHDHKKRMEQVLGEFRRETMIPAISLPHGFEPRCDSQGKERSVNFEPAPAWSSTPIIDGATMRERDGFVPLTENALTAADLERLCNALPKDGESDRPDRPARVLRRSHP